jgi:hypothetical protein
LIFAFAGYDSIAPLSALGGPQLVHLLHALLELDILALFVRMSLVLQRVLAIDLLTSSNFIHVPRASLATIFAELHVDVVRCYAPRTSTAGKTPPADTGSRE